MAIESATYISDLVTSNPTGDDQRSTVDDHLRLIKKTIQSTFPNISGAVTPTHTELNYVDGVTSPIQDQIDAAVDDIATKVTSGATASITFEMIETVTQYDLLGRKTAGAGVIETVSLDEVLGWLGTAAQGDIIYRSATVWAFLPAGTSGKFLKTQGAGANPTWATVTQPTLAAAQSSAATHYDFVIPAGVNRIDVIFNALSYNATANNCIRLGTGGVPATSGYIAGANESLGTTLTTATDGFITDQGGIAGDSVSGVMQLRHVGGNIWVASGVFYENASALRLCGGVITLAGELDIICVTTQAGTAVVDGGSVTVQYM